jgi:ComF family protein
VRNLLNSAVSGAAIVAQGLFAALFPSDCRLCGTPLENISRLPVCPGCLLAMQPISGETCDICGERLPGLQRLSDLQTCPACQEARPNFVKAAAYGSYEGDLRELIHLLKYEQVVPAAGALGKMLAEAIGKLGIGSGSVLVIPVPLHSSKRRQRGFNQAELITRAALKQPPMAQAELATDVLERRRPTVSQIGLTRPQRSQNIRGAFRVVHLNTVSGRNVLLIDDVLTTGTTASECARVLRKAGAKQVWVATVARTLKNSATSFEIEPEFETAAQAS